MNIYLQKIYEYSNYFNEEKINKQYFNIDLYEKSITILDAVNLLGNANYIVWNVFENIIFLYILYFKTNEKWVNNTDVFNIVRFENYVLKLNVKQSE